MNKVLSFISVAYKLIFYLGDAKQPVSACQDKTNKLSFHLANAPTNS